MNEVKIESRGRESQLHDEKYTQRKNSRTISHEDKVEMQDITSKYEVANYVDKKNLEWNTDLIETLELEHVTSQAAQDLNDGETRHESR